jgi:hypothetical protein
MILAKLLNILHSCNAMVSYDFYTGVYILAESPILYNICFIYTNF